MQYQFCVFVCILFCYFVLSVGAFFNFNRPPLAILETLFNEKAELEKGSAVAREINERFADKLYSMDVDQLFVRAWHRSGTLQFCVSSNVHRTVWGCVPMEPVNTSVRGVYWSIYIERKNALWQVGIPKVFTEKGGLRPVQFHSLLMSSIEAHLQQVDAKEAAKRAKISEASEFEQEWDAYSTGN